VTLTPPSSFRAFGSAIRVVVKGTAPGSARTATGVAVNTCDSGNPFLNSVARCARDTEFHMHGGIIAVHVDDTISNVDGVGIYVGDSVGATGGKALAHTPGTAYVVKSSAGATRVEASGDARALVPFMWESGTDVPVANLVSQTGSDVFVETDCNNATGVCDGSGTTRPHLMVYDASCSPTPWFNVVTGECRAQ
jgi:hypothetical protein